MSSSGDTTAVSEGPDFFSGLLPQSSMALSMAAAILRQTGMEGWMMVYIPPDAKVAPCEVMTSTHGWSLSFDPGSFNPRKKR